MDSTVTLAVGSQARSVSEGLWLRSRSWDLTFISLSALLVPVPILVYVFANQISWAATALFSSVGISLRWDADASRNLVNGLIALSVGGPHMYATWTRTAFDKAFTRRHKALMALSLLVPAGVIYFGVTAFSLLVTFFFFWASVHIIHQAAFIVDCYNRKSPVPVSLASRLIDYAPLATALFPVATWKLVRGEFLIGRIRVYFPEFLKDDAFAYLVTVVFAASCVLFTWKTLREIRSGVANYPKILLISLTAGVAFLVPAFSNLDVAFQGFNAWHSFQYLGLTYSINRIRQERGQISTPFIEKMSREGTAWRFYLFNAGITCLAVAAIGILIALHPVLGLSFDQCYYIVVLSFLLMHYLHDHVLFSMPEAMVFGRPS